MKIRCFSLLLWFACAFYALGAWRLTTTDEASAGSLGRHVRVLAKESDTGERAQLHVALFDMGKATLRVIDQPNEPRSDLGELMLSERCLAGVNGGYFDPDYKPVGLLVSGGRTIAPFRRARLLSGVLSVASGRVRLQRIAEFSKKAKLSEALQCGPFLVDHGRIVTGLDDMRSARRTFVAMGTGEKFALGYCSDISLAQLSQVLAAGKVTDDFRVERALNLDGGSSSAFWFAGDPPFSIPEQKTVRDFLGAVTK